MYEEIGDVQSSFTYTQNVLYGLSTDRVTHRLTSDPVREVPTDAQLPSDDNEPNTHNYELIQIADYQSIDDAYKIQQCSAYGITSSVDQSCDPSMLHDSLSESLDATSRSHEPSNLHSPKRSCNPSKSCDLNISCDLDDPCDPAHDQESCNINNLCNSDLEENCCAHRAVAEASHDLSDPDQGVTSVADESCDLEECPAYGVMKPDTAYY